MLVLCYAILIKSGCNIKIKKVENINILHYKVKAEALQMPSSILQVVVFKVVMLEEIYCGWIGTLQLLFRLKTKYKVVQINVCW